MSDNDDEKQDWIFTWGFGQGHDNCYTTIYGTFKSAREEMFKRYGKNWGFQYASKEAAGVDRFKLTKIK